MMQFEESDRLEVDVQVQGNDQRGEIRANPDPNRLP
jgi:hypothetical protein